jgi:hypothetical protein
LVGVDDPLFLPITVPNPKQVARAVRRLCVGICRVIFPDSFHRFRAFRAALEDAARVVPILGGLARGVTRLLSITALPEL